MNAQITEDYVSFETAKLLKEKGFDEGLHWQQVTGRYALRGFSFERWDWGIYEISYKEGEFIHFHDQYFYYTEVKDKKNTIVAPTLQMVMKWMRVIHNIDVSITPDRKKNYTALVFVNKELPFVSIGSFQTYEEACEAAIKYCLENLI